MQLSIQERYDTLDQHLSYLEHSFIKIGNQISLKPIGYYRVESQKNMKADAPSNDKVMLVVNVTNHGLSDQVMDDNALQYQNINFHTPVKMNNALVTKKVETKKLPEQKLNATEYAA